MHASRSFMGKGSFAPISGVVCPHLISSNILFILSSMASVASISIFLNMLQYQNIRLMSLMFLPA